MNKTLSTLRHAIFIVFGITLILILASLLTGCVSIKRYDALMSDYQKASEQLRSLGHEVAVMHYDNQDTKRELTSVRAKLDSLSNKKEARDE